MSPKQIAEIRRRLDQVAAARRAAGEAENAVWAKRMELVAAAPPVPPPHSATSNAKGRKRK